MATVIASAIIDLVAMPLVLQRILGLSALRFLRRACARPLMVAVLQVVLLLGIRTIGQPTSWIKLVTQGFMATAASTLVVLAVGLTASERRRFLFQPLGRLVRGVGKPAEVAAS